MQDVDCGRAWLVLAASAYNCAVALGVGMNCGVYIAAMIAYYGSNRADGYVVGALSYGMIFSSGPVASVLIDRTSHRAVAVSGACLSCIGLVMSANVPTIHYQYLTFGVITAIGYGFMYQSSMVVLMIYFHKYLAIATSLALAGAAVGILIFPIISQAVIDAYSWQPSLYIIAGISLNTCVGSMLIRPRPPPNLQCRWSISVKEEGTPTIATSQSTNVESNLLTDEVIEPQPETKDSNTHNNKLLTRGNSDYENSKISMANSIKSKKSELNLMKNGYFLLYILSAYLASANCVPVFIIAPDLYQQGGVTTPTQSMLYSTFGVCSILGRIVCGWLFLKWFTPVTVHCVTGLICGFTISLFMFNSNLAALFSANVIFAVSYGAHITCCSLVTLEIVGMMYVNRAFGYINLAIGLGGVITPPLLGVMYDSLRTYTWSMLLASIFGIFTAIVMIPNTALCRNWREKRDNRTSKT